MAGPTACLIFLFSFFNTKGSLVFKLKQTLSRPIQLYCITSIFGMQTSESKVSTSYMGTVFSSSSQFLLLTAPDSCIPCHFPCQADHRPEHVCFSQPGNLLFALPAVKSPCSHQSRSLTFSPAIGKAAGEEGRVS